MVQARVLAALTVSWLGLSTVEAQQGPPPVDASVFPSIKPSKDLEWHDCFGVFKCARLLVPAKVSHNPKRAQECGKTVALAIVKLPYVQQIGGPPRKGSVHFAMGGWSQSNTNFLIRYGQGYTPLFSGYDLVAIDYRGWGWSTPSFRCFKTEEERQQFAASEPALLGFNHASLEARRARAEDFAERCYNNAGEVGKYMGTYANAVDHYTYMKMSGDSKMSFWGVSSGTHVGQTIAALYPEAVDKFFFDAVQPSDPAYTVTGAQPSNIKDSDRALEAFFVTCLKAGSQACAFVGNSTTPAELRTRFNTIDAALKKKAIPVSGSPKPFDWSAFRIFLTTAEHGPGWFQVLGGVLSEAERGVAEGWIPYVVFNVVGKPPAPLPQVDDDTPFDGILSGVAIDEANHLKNNNDFRNYFEDLQAAAPTVAPIFAEWRLIGQKWKIPTLNRYPGPLTGKVDLAPTGGKVMIFAGAADPASSRASADAVAARFQPSVVVRNNGAGHTTFSAQSDCLFTQIYVLFNYDALPAPGTVCGNITNAPFQPLNVQLPDGF